MLWISRRRGVDVVVNVPCCAFVLCFTLLTDTLTRILQSSI